jgi:hypothetical protein
MQHLWKSKPVANPFTSGAVISWASGQCVVAREHMGLRKSAQSVDKHGPVCAVGDASGTVLLERWPCTHSVHSTTSYAHVHGTAVSDVHFLCDGQHLLSVSDADGTVAQWKVVGPEEPADTVTALPDSTQAKQPETDASAISSDAKGLADDVATLDAVDDTHSVVTEGEAAEHSDVKRSGISNLHSPRQKKKKKKALFKKKVDQQQESVFAMSDAHLKTLAVLEIDLRGLERALPTTLSEVDKKERLRLLTLMDSQDQNGFISLEHLKQGFRYESFRGQRKLSWIPKFCLPMFLRAYAMALAGDEVKAPQFQPPSSIPPNAELSLIQLRYFFIYIKLYVQLFCALKLIDENFDSVITFDEFNLGLRELEKLNLHVEDPLAIFAAIDVNNDKELDFDELCVWMIRSELRHVLDHEDKLRAANVALAAIPDAAASNGRLQRLPDATKVLDKYSYLDFDFADLKQALPIGSDEASKAERKRLFKKFDSTGTHRLCLAEVQKGLRDCKFMNGIRLTAVYDDCVPALRRAYIDSKNVGCVSGVEDPDGAFIDLREFKYLLALIRRYVEFWYVKCWMLADACVYTPFLPLFL